MDPIAMINDILKFFEGLKADAHKPQSPQDQEILAEVNGVAAASGIPGAEIGHGGVILPPPGNAVIGVDIKSMILSPKGLFVTVILIYIGYRIYEATK